MDQEINQARSGIAPENIQDVIDAEVSAKWATLQGQNQYFTPTDKAKEWLAKLTKLAGESWLSSVVDPQYGDGSFANGAYASTVLGIEIDSRFKHQEDRVLRCNCVKAFEILDDIDPNYRFQCAVANPPFAKKWKVGEAVVDSTELTWKWCQKHARCGVFVSNQATIERLGYHKHESCVDYETHANLWKNCAVIVGVVFWVRKDVERESVTSYYVLQEMWRTASTILEEERAGIPPFNVWLGKHGKLVTNLSMRQRLKRKMTRDQILRLARIQDCHPLTLTTERETRKLLYELVNDGVYVIEPKAHDAIKHALADVEKISAPIMPPTEFELVAYADEEDSLLCNQPNEHGFEVGKRYEITTATYTVRQPIQRKKLRYPEGEEEDGKPVVELHDCAIIGNDRYIQIANSKGLHYKFMAHPDPDDPRYELSEEMLWKIFELPEVKTIADKNRAEVTRIESCLRTCELLGNFSYYPGQFEYLTRVCLKNKAYVAADTGAGKSLFAISIIAVKAPKRALIVAPQGTVKDEDGNETEHDASQWIGELSRFAPYLRVFRLWDYDDYLNILKRHKGVLPNGVYISYYQAMFSNGACETKPSKMTDDALRKRCKVDEKVLPPHPDDPECGWSKTIGKEKNGFRCILEPCMSTLIADQFDMIILDEAHQACHLSSNITQMVIRMQPKFRFALTATPIPNVISNMFPLMGWLCVDNWYLGDHRNAAWPYAREELGRFESTFMSVERDFTEERNKRSKDYAFNGKCISVSPIISSPARLLKILKPTMAYISKLKCNPQMVELNAKDIRVGMGREQAMLYEHFLNRNNIDSGSALIRARKQIAYLRGICADPANFEYGGPSVKNNFNPKTWAILELIRDILAKREQVVVVCSRKGQTSTLHNLLISSGVTVSRIDSTVQASRHAYEADQFKRHKSQVQLMGIKCAQAYSFPECSHLIIGSLEYTCGSKIQAEGRVYRVNSAKPVNTYCILHANTIEEIMFDKVACKEDSARICLHGRRVPRDFVPTDMSELLAIAAEVFDFTGLAEEASLEAKWPALSRQLAAVAQR